MAEIGKLGWQALVTRKFMGDEAAAKDWLHAHKNESALMKAAQVSIDRQLANGATIACEEIPCVLHPDDDPFYEEALSWADRERNRREASRAIEGCSVPF